MKKILAAALAAMMMAAMLVGCSAGSSQNPGDSQDSGSSASGKFVVGLDDQFPPMGFRDDNNDIAGFDIDLAKAVGEKMGMEVELKPIDWDSKELELEAGNVDCVWNGLSVTPQREKDMLLSEPYLANDQVILVKKGSEFKTKASLDGKKIAVQKASSAVDAMDKDGMSDRVEKVEFADNVSVLNELEIGRVEGAVLDEVVARYYMTKKPDTFELLDETLAEEFYAVGFKKGNNDLKNAVEKAFGELIKDGKVAEISQKWFGENRFLEENFK
ncbi:amino acid ABC transporter substrate-binding protein [Candidatus Soleaferrea massiliensis]|uniref:amino acid ABC transporter substrate-binding protein n=1 Tax=Candidatus Soleaferrea massiliensis TaxID=1470354 RepID=UPI00058E6D59|nr:amino acid ABC transporter substrate-binding protein [Candidatus Soleaferrea massiliensis]